MNPNDLATKYRLLNSSFKKTMIYHIGIDAGFFTEYTYMVSAYFSHIFRLFFL